MIIVYGILSLVYKALSGGMPVDVRDFLSYICYISSEAFSNSQC